MDKFGLLSIKWNYWFLQTVAMGLTALVLPKLKITSIFGAITTVAGLAFVNSKIWDAALFFHIPNQLSMHIIALFLANGVIFWILVKLLPGIEISGFFTAFVAPVIFTIFSLIIEKYGQQIDWYAILWYFFDAIASLKDYVYKDINIYR